MNGGRLNRRTITVGAIIGLLIAGNLLVHYPMPRVSITPEVLTYVGSFPITNSLLSTWLAMATCTLLFWLVCRDLRSVPGRLQALVEFTVEALLNLCTGVVGERRGRAIFPLIATIFLFILSCNWMGLLPGFGTIGIYESTAAGSEFVPLFRAGTTDLNTTIALALVSVVAAQVLGVRAVGALPYLGKFINFREGPIGFFVGILELISEFARLISYSFRLFGNVFAGEILLVVIAFLIPFGVALPFLGLEMFVGAIQAFIFAILTLMFVSMATEPVGGHSRGEETTAQSRAH